MPIESLHPCILAGGNEQSMSTCGEVRPQLGENALYRSEILFIGKY